MKTLQFIIISLGIGVGLVATNHMALAQKVAKIVADEDNDIGP